MAKKNVEEKVELISKHANFYSSQIGVLSHLHNEIELAIGLLQSKYHSENHPYFHELNKFKKITAHEITHVNGAPGCEKNENCIYKTKMPE